MSEAGVIDRLNDLLSSLAGEFTSDDDEVDLRNPVLTEWVLLANVQDLESGSHRGVLLCAPHMLYSHVIGLLTLGNRWGAGD
ncbi:hypothetical protein AB0P21_09690 [Kribbella sp. NPDC056861]|uniref:hypothetical protein n=1 Tax=Kribbella sp. NPDC056861 TaxID=3154857 RepID=UPI003415E0F6